MQTRLEPLDTTLKCCVTKSLWSMSQCARAQSIGRWQCINEDRQDTTADTRDGAGWWSVKTFAPNVEVVA